MKRTLALAAALIAFILTATCSAVYDAIEVVEVYEENYYIQDDYEEVNRFLQDLDFLYDTLMSSFPYANALI